MTESRWIAHVRALIADGEGRLLVLEDGSRHRLPAVEIEGTDDELPAIREALAALVGFDTIVVRSVTRSVDEERKILDVALELEPRGASAPAAGAVWRTGSQLAASALPSGDRSLVDRLESDRPPPERPQWARRGWFAEASAWIETVLAEHGRRTVEPVEQVSNWCISSVLRVATEEGRVYFKATAPSPLFVDEGTVTQGLAALFPGRIPRPLAVDVDRRWMLLDDFGAAVGWEADLETRIEVLSTYARMQLEAATRQDELLALGLLDRRPAWLAAGIDSLLASAVPEVEDAEAEELARLAPSFVEACERLAAGAVPDSLVHGDLHLGNVAGDRERYVFFDWTDACVTHPFLDLLAVVFEKDPDLRLALRNAYLGEWSELASEDELLELWRLAEPLACLNQAISYRSILANVERGTAPDLEPLTAYWLRMALVAQSAALEE